MHNFKKECTVYKCFSINEQQIIFMINLSNKNESCN